MVMDNCKDNKLERFLEYIGKYKKSIYCYILGSVLDCHEAEDILQETLLCLWSEFEKFQEGTNFMAWAITVARHRVLVYFNKKKRRREFICDDFIRRLGLEITENDNNYARLKALEICMTKLNDHDREMVLSRYNEKIPVKQMAASKNVTVQRIYQVIIKIQEVLLKCIQKTIAMDDAL